MEGSSLQSQKTLRKGFRPSTVNSSHSKSRLSFVDRSKSQNNLKITASFKNDQIAVQIRKEIDQINSNLKSAHGFSESLTDQKRRRSIKTELFDIEEIIKSKDDQIKIVLEEIKHLKNNKSSYYSKQSPVKESSKKNDQIFTLAEELRSERQRLQSVQRLHFEKLGKLKQIKNAVQSLEQAYVEKCDNTHERPISYHEFKTLNEEKKRELEDQIKKVPLRNSQARVSMRRKSPKKDDQKVAKKTLKQLQNRKQIAEQALKNSLKKHNSEINQLMAKLEFLQDEDLSLLEKIKEKEEQMNHLEGKFKESRISRGLKHSRVSGDASPAKRRDLFGKLSSRRPIYGQD